MAICKYCNQDVENGNTKSCNFLYIVIDGKKYKRNTTYFDSNDRYHDCNIENKEGNIHHFGCDIDRCPICGEQLIYCDCLDDKKIELQNL